jgi:hypothetical protein
MIQLFENAGSIPIHHIIRESVRVLVKFKLIESQLIKKNKLKTYVVGNVVVQTTASINNSKAIAYIISENPKLKLSDVKEETARNSREDVDSDNTE